MEYPTNPGPGRPLRHPLIITERPCYMPRCWIGYPYLTTGAYVNYKQGISSCTRYCYPVIRYLRARWKRGDFQATWLSLQRAFMSITLWGIFETKTLAITNQLQESRLNRRLNHKAKSSLPIFSSKLTFVTHSRPRMTIHIQERHFGNLKTTKTHS